MGHRFLSQAYFRKQLVWLNALQLPYRNHGFLLVNLYTEDSNKDYYRVNVFNAGIDVVLADFTARYGTHLRLSAGLTCLSLVGEKTWADVKDAHRKYSTYLPGTVSEVQAEFVV